MNATNYAIRLIIDGYVAVPDVVTGDELEDMRAGFERQAAALGKRWMNWDEISEVPELVRYIAHPKLMAVIDAYLGHFGHEAVFANSSGVRDVYDPAKPAKNVNTSDLRNSPIGWHDDVMGMRHPNAKILQTTLTSLLYLDDTSVESGAYCAAAGSHHVSYADGEKPVMPPAATVLDNCELRPVPVTAGSVIIHRGHHWHGVLPVHRQRRLMLQTFSARDVYDLQEGHTQLSAASIALIPPGRERYICHYKTAEAAAA